MAAPAHADVTPSDATTALDLPSGVTAVVAGSGVVSTQPFNDFPSAGSSYLTLSTGDASQVFGSAQDAQLSTDVGNDGQPDSASVTFTVSQASNAQCLLVDYAMGTEEPVHTYTTASPSDTLSIVKTGDVAQYAMNAGNAYFSQDGYDPAPKPYAVNAINYWHAPGDPTDAAPGAYSATEIAPRLPGVTGINDWTSRDTARVPLDLSGGDATVTLSVSDATNGDLDSVATVDHVRLLTTGCSNGTGVEPNPANNGGVIGGIKQVGAQLYYDPVPSTSVIEGSADLANGWRSPSNVPVELRYRWYRTTASTGHTGDMNSWTAIPDADRQSYVPTAIDWGKYLIVLVSGVVDGRRIETYPSTGTATTWYVTTAIEKGTFESGSAPIITGPDGRTAGVGDVLSAQIDNTFPRQDSWTWQWFANGLMISGATAQTLTLDAAQAGKTITVKATAVRDKFDSKSWTSNGYGPVTYEEFGAVGKPTIVTDGTPTVGETVNVDPGAGWSPAPTSYSYQWKRNGTVISGATLSAYTLKAADAGVQLTVAVSGVLPGYRQVPQDSDPVAVLGSTQLGATPTVSGSAQVGQTLTGTVVGWDPSGATLRWDWYAGGTVVQTGSSHTLKVPAAAVGKAITLQVTGTRTGYAPLTRASAPTSIVTRGVLTSAQPKIIGLAKVGVTLYVSKGYWGPTGVALSYQWRINGSAVAGAAGKASTFRVPNSARGKRITVSVTGRLSGYTTVTRTSPATAKVLHA
ncbi:hypothetical protein GCM10028801_18970 [Nocardioides maradonensis]